MRKLAALIIFAVFFGVPSQAFSAEEKFQVMGYFLGNASDAKGTYSRIQLKPNSSATTLLRLRGVTLDEAFERTYLELIVKMDGKCSLDCDGSLVKVLDVINPVAVRSHPLRGKTRRVD